MKPAGRGRLGELIVKPEGNGVLGWIECGKKKKTKMTACDET